LCKDEAEPLFRRALEIYEKVLGAEDPDTVAALQNLAANLENQGKYAEADALLKRVSETEEEVVDPKDSDPIEPVQSLADDLNSQSKEAEGSILAPEHPTTDPSEQTLAHNVDRQDQYLDAEPQNQPKITELPFVPVLATLFVICCVAVGGYLWRRSKSQKEGTKKNQSQIEWLKTDEMKVPIQAPIQKDQAYPTETTAIQSLQTDIIRLSQNITDLGSLFEKRILYTDHEEKIVDKMHEELQKHREDMYSQLVRPILLDIIQIRKSMVRISSVPQNKAEEAIPLKTFETYIFEIQEILERNNIEMYRCEPGTEFVPIRQRVTEKIPTLHKSMHGKVARTLSEGYEYMGKTITPEQVAVYSYEQ
jgi:molecular chaperone GrpE (heat shock protein)